MTFLIYLSTAVKLHEWLHKSQNIFHDSTMLTYMYTCKLESKIQCCVTRLYSFVHVNTEKCFTKATRYLIWKYRYMIVHCRTSYWLFFWAYGYWMHQWMECDADLLHEFSNAYSHTSNLTLLPCSVIDHVTLKLQWFNGTQNMHDAKIIEKDLLVGSRCFMNTWNIFRHVKFYLCTKITAVYERTKIPTRE